MSNRRTTSNPKATTNSSAQYAYRDATAGLPRQAVEPPRNNVAYDNRRPIANVNDSYLRSHSNSSLSFNHSSTGRRNAPMAKPLDHLRNVGGEVPLSQTNIYIRGLPPTFTADDLNDLCSKFGRIVSTKAVLDPDSQRCRGYGFIDFESPQAATEALSTINTEGVYEAEMAKDIRARPNKHLEQDPTNLYIANLPPDYTENSIRQLLNNFGMVISTRVLRNADGTSRCVGFARMDSKESCDQIISHYNGKKLDENCDPLVVKLADSGARRPKHSTSSSGQSSDQTMCSSTWSGAQSGRYAYQPATYGDQTVSFSPVLPNGSYPMYDPNTFAQTMTGVPNVPSIPMGVPYSNLVYQSPNRQMSMGSTASNTAISNQVLYQAPFQGTGFEYYGKPIYKTPPNYTPPSYYQTFSPYPSEYVNQQQYGAVYGANPPVSEDECYQAYPNGSVGNAIYIQSPYYPMASQPEMAGMTSVGSMGMPQGMQQMPPNVLSVSADPQDQEGEEEDDDGAGGDQPAGGLDRRAVSAEHTPKTGDNAGSTDHPKVHPSASDTRLNNPAKSS
ncbi:hypothetical protein M3Y99_01509200 [Aphelenchoides fujianensis]|nr:hypothetical protein M3Y99_01509200 [Aphelenchoides fujianensis]